MSKLEKTLLGIFIAVMCPAALFIISGIIAATLAIYPLSDKEIGLAALTGFAFGILLTCFRLRRWLELFYRANLGLMAVIYLFWSVVAFGVSMGLPPGNLLLGTFAGVYIGRRRYHEGAGREVFLKSRRKVSIFTALVTGIEVLPVAFLVLRTNFGTLRGLIFSAIGCLVLGLFQFWCTRGAAGLAFRKGRKVYS